MVLGRSGIRVLLPCSLCCWIHPARRDRREDQLPGVRRPRRVRRVLPRPARRTDAAPDRTRYPGQLHRRRGRRRPLPGRRPAPAVRPDARLARRNPGRFPGPARIQPAITPGYRGQGAVSPSAGRPSATPPPRPNGCSVSVGSQMSITSVGIPIRRSIASGSRRGSRCVIRPDLCTAAVLVRSRKMPHICGRGAAGPAGQAGSGPTRWSSHCCSGAAVRRKPTTRSFAPAVYSHGAAGHCRQQIRPLQRRSPIRAWSPG